jgi:hypothetical protein
VRFARPLLVASIPIALVACDGGDDVAPLPIEQRFLTAEDAPGTDQDPVETRQTTTDLDEFSMVYRLIDPDEDEMATLLRDAGFEGTGVDSRFVGESHSPTVPHLVSSFIELESEDGATSVLDWLEADVLKPCPGSCATRITTFDVEDIADARGVRRIATAEDIEAAGTEDEQPLDSYWVGFTVGSLVYTVELRGSPGSVSEEQALNIASAYHDRLTRNEPR